MQSKKSSSKGALLSTTLLKKNLTRFWPLWGGASLVGSVMPLYLLLNLLSPFSSGSVQARDIALLLYGFFAIAVPGITLVYAVLCAMTVWSYLYNSRSVGMLHSLPVDRRCLFLTNTLSGLAMMLLPYVVVGAFTVLVCLFFGILPVVAALQVAAGVLGLSIFYFATATLCAHLTSHIFALPAFYFVGHFFAVGFQWLISSFATNFIFGYTGGAAPAWVRFFSPTVFLNCLDWNSQGEEGMPVLEGLWAVGVYTLIGFALLALAFLLYRRRHSESAGEVVAYRALKPIFRYGVALASALTLGQLLYEILWRMPFQNGIYAQIVPMGICMALAGILGYYVASMLLKKSLRVFRGDWQGPVTVAAAIVILCGCVSLDLFGIASAVPQAGEVEEVSLSFNYADTPITCQEGDALLEEVLALHRTLVDQESAIRTDANTLMAGAYLDDAPEARGLHLIFHYTLDSGKVLHRSYALYVDQALWEDESTYAGAVNRLFHSPETREHLYRIPEGGVLTMGYYDFYNLYDGGDDYEDYYGELTQDQAKAVHEALLLDAREGNIPDMDPFYSAASLGTLQIEYFVRVQREDSNNTSTDSIYLELYDTMTHTLRALEDVGALPVPTDGNFYTMPLPDPEAEEYVVVPLPSTEQA